MTKRDFLILMIKLFGLYVAENAIFSFIPNTIYFGWNNFDVFAATWMVIALAITVGLFLTLTFKADRLVDFFALSKGFSDDRIALENLKSQDVLKIGTFVTGGLIFVRNVPTLLSDAFWAFKGDLGGMEFTAKNKLDLAVAFLNVIVGFLLLTNYAFVARLLKGKDQ